MGREKAARTFAVYALTETGQAYCDEAARRDGEYVRADERIAALIELQRRAPEGERRRPMRAMHEEATTLLRTV